MSLIRFFPVAALLYFTLLNLVTAIPFALYPDRTPWFLSDKNPIEESKWILILLASAGNSMVIIAILLGLGRLIGRDLNRWIGSLLLAIIYVSLTGASFYFLEFGSYPGLELIVEAFRSPKLITSYAAYGAESKKLFAFIIICLPIFILTFLSVRSLSLNYRWVHSSIVAVVCSIAFLACIAWGSRLKIEYKVYGSFANLSLPVFKLWDEVIGQPTTSIISSVKHYLPVAKSIDKEPIAIENLPRHVVLVVTESLRHDHLPIYGYGRNTTPNMLANKSKWTAYRRFYAHGSWTAASFSIMFSSRYLAAINEGALAVRLSNRFWRALRDHKINTAFISSGDLEWGGVSSRIGSTEINYVVGSRDATVEEKKKHELFDQIDNSLADRFALERYENFLNESKDRSFATLFLMGTHFPYRAVDEVHPYKPILVPGQSFDSQIDKRTRYINSYDNSIIGFDTIISELIMILSKKSLLDNSLILITGDHGESLGDNNNYYHGFQLTEDQVHVPLLIYGGASLDKVRQRLQGSSEGLNGHIDIAPTILDLFSLPAIDEHQGYSIISHAGKPYEIIPYASLARKVAIVDQAVKYIYDIDSSIVSIEQIAAAETSDKAVLSQSLHSSMENNNQSRAINGASLEQFLITLAERNIIKKRASN